MTPSDLLQEYRRLIEEREVHRVRLREIDVQVAEAERRLQRLLISSQAPTAQKQPDGVPARVAEPAPAASIARRIVDYLSSNRGAAFDAVQINDALGHGNITTIRGTLARLTAARRVARTEPGKYRAV